MLAGFSLFMMAAARAPNNEGCTPHSSHGLRRSPSSVLGGGGGTRGRRGGGGGGGGGGNRKPLAHPVPGRERGDGSGRPPRPNHFLSVRIDNANIWQNVLAIQEDIVDSHPHLKEAAIPVQDLHLTLFVATLHEQDGSLQRAKEILQNAGDILVKHGLSPEASGADSTLESATARGGELRSTGPSLARGDRLLAPFEDYIGATSLPDCGVDGESGGGGDGGLVAPINSDVKSRGASKETELLIADGVDDGAPPGTLAGTVSPPPPPDATAAAAVAEGTTAGIVAEGAVAPMSLSFGGLATFNNKVLYACLVEDRHAGRLRNLASSLHARFLEAQLVKSEPSKSWRVQEDDRPFDFQPHLTVMKTSKLSDRRTLIPPSSYSRHQDSLFGSHSPQAVELSSMLEREEETSDGDGGSRPYYKCVQRLDLRPTAN